MIPWTVACQAPLSMGFPGQNTGVGCHFLSQMIFPTQELNPRLLHWQADSLPLSHQEEPQLLFSLAHYSTNMKIPRGHATSTGHIIQLLYNWDDPEESSPSLVLSFPSKRKLTFNQMVIKCWRDWMGHTSENLRNSGLWVGAAGYHDE